MLEQHMDESIPDMQKRIIAALNIDPLLVAEWKQHYGFEGVYAKLFTRALEIANDDETELDPLLVFMLFKFHRFYSK